MAYECKQQDHSVVTIDDGNVSLRSPIAGFYEERQELRRQGGIIINRFSSQAEENRTQLIRREVLI